MNLIFIWYKWSNKISIFLLSLFLSLSALSFYLVYVYLLYRYADNERLPNMLNKKFQIQYQNMCDCVCVCLVCNVISVLLAKNCLKYASTKIQTDKNHILKRDVKLYTDDFPLTSFVFDLKFCVEQ